LEAFVTEHLDSGRAPISSELIRSELMRAVWRGGLEARRTASELLNDMEQIPISRVILDHAGALLPGERLRTLDAIHLTSALGLGDDLLALVTYDARLLEAAARLGIRTASPT
jgi:predicted nucleic acid-binding protein